MLHMLSGNTRIFETIILAITARYVQTLIFFVIDPAPWLPFTSWQTLGKHPVKINLRCLKYIKTQVIQLKADPLKALER